MFALRLSSRFCPDDLAAFLAELYGQQKVPVLKVITSRRNCSACINGRIPSGVFGEIPLCGRRWFPDGGIDQVRSLSLSPSSISPPTPPTFQAKWTAAGSLATLLSIAATSLAMIAWKKWRRRRRRRESGSEEFRHLVQEAARRSKKIVTYFSALLLLFSADV